MHIFTLSQTGSAASKFLSWVNTAHFSGLDSALFPVTGLQLMLPIHSHYIVLAASVLEASKGQMA